MNRRPSTRSFAIVLVSTALVGVLGSVAAATSDLPAQRGPAVPAFCNDSDLLPRTPDSAERWLQQCP